MLLLQGALRNAISTFVHVSPVLKDSIWSYLEQYDLPVVVGPHVGKSAQAMTTQVGLNFIFDLFIYFRMCYSVSEIILL